MIMLGSGGKSRYKHVASIGISMCIMCGKQACQLLSCWLTAVAMQTVLEGAFAACLLGASDLGLSKVLPTQVTC